jgi:DNA-binding transcriptional ArsR family regulator
MSASINTTFRVLSHKMRVDILTMLVDAGQPMSPTELSHSLGVALNNLSYHVRVLADNGLLVLVNTRPRRGTLEHFYSPAEGVPALIRSAGQVNDAAEEVAA